MKTKLSTLILSKLTFSSLKLTFTLLMLAFTTLTLTFTACSNDDEDNILSEDEGKQLAHPAVVNFSAGITTRVTTSSEWEAGDLVGISASEIAGTVSTPKYTNIQYKADIAGASTAFSLVETEQEEIAYTSENDMISQHIIRILITKMALSKPTQLLRKKNKRRLIFYLLLLKESILRGMQIRK